MPSTPTLPGVLDAALRSKLLDVRVAMPAKVISYDAAKQAVDVRPLLKRPLRNAEGELEARSLPTISGVPVAFPGAGGFRMTFPVQAGDLCLLVFSDGALDGVKSSGEEVDPVDPRSHHLTDAVAIFGVRSFATPWTGASTANMTVGKDGGPQIHFKDGRIALGEENPSDAVALAQLVLDRLNDIKTWLNAHTHPVSGAAAGPSVPSFGPIIGVGSSTVQCK